MREVLNTSPFDPPVARKPLNLTMSKSEVLAILETVRKDQQGPDPSCGMRGPRDVLAVESGTVRKFASPSSPPVKPLPYNVGDTVRLRQGREDRIAVLEAISACADGRFAISARYPGGSTMGIYQRKEILLV